VFPDAYGLEDEGPFTLTTLDPRNTFVIYSSEIGHPPVMAGVFYSIPSRELSGERFVYLIYTHDYIYRYENDGALVGVIEPSDLVDSQINILGEIPIVEYPNNVFRLGDWEIAKELLDAINVVGSDSVNDLQQFVNSLLVAVNVELDDTHKKDIQENKIVSIVSSKELPAELKYISEQLDAGSAQELRDWLLEQMRLIVGIPSRDARSGGGGDTGDAVYLRDGFQQLEIVARTKETFFKRAERATLRLLVSLAQKEGELKKLAVKDIDIRFSRNMTDGILSKANAISILHSTNVLDPTDVLSLVGVTTEPDELVKRGELYWKDEPKKDDVKVKEITPNDPQLLRKTDRE
jgi:SPP1 family phage portal protein